MNTLYQAKIQNRLSVLCIFSTFFLFSIYTILFNRSTVSSIGYLSNIISEVNIDNNSSLKFETMNDLLCHHFSCETTVQTSGFYYPNDGGGTTYNITKNPKLKVNPYTTFTLDNGYYAEIQFDASSNLNLASMGISPNTKVSAQLNNIFNLMENQVSGFIFNEGTYYIECPLYLKSFNYYGNNTTLAVSKDFSGDEINIILTKKADVSPYKIGLYDLNFLYETSKDHSLHNIQSVFVALRNIKSCQIYNCNFVAQPASINGDFMEVVVLWFKQTDVMNNIDIQNCNISNLTGKNYTGSESDVLLGGTLLFSGPKGTYNNKYSNIKIKNCNLQSSINDETLSFWNGNFNNVNIKNCTISNIDHPSNNFITFYSGEFHSFSMTDCIINVNVPARNIIKYRMLTNPSDINFIRCKTYFNIIPNSSSFQTNAFFKVDDSTLNGMSNATFDGCEFYSPNQNLYDSLFRINNMNNFKIYINSCSFDCDTKYAKGWISNSNNIKMDINNSQGIKNGFYSAPNTTSTVKVQ